MENEKDRWVAVRVIFALLFMGVTSVVATCPGSASASELFYQAPSVVIIDTSLNQDIPIFDNKIIYEVCILDYPVCPNGTSFQEGYGAAKMSSAMSIINGFEHGTQMTSVAINTNPNIKIIFIRIVSNTATGGRMSSNYLTLDKALYWVIRNRDRFNIQSVAFSQGSHNYNSIDDYCPSVPSTESNIRALASTGIPFFAAVGNNYDYKRIDWPACIPETIAIGAVMPYLEIASYNNYDAARIDFYALGSTKAYNPNGSYVNIAGSSPATQIASMNWATVKYARPELSYSQVYELLSNTSTNTYNSRISSGKLINQSGALKSLGDVLNITTSTPSVFSINSTAPVDLGSGGIYSRTSVNALTNGACSLIFKFAGSTERSPATLIWNATVTNR